MNTSTKQTENEAENGNKSKPLLGCVNSESDMVKMYIFQTPGPSCSFSPMVTLKGFEKIEGKDNKRFHELMNELKYECLKLEVHFESKIYETKDISINYVFGFNAP